ncbi:MAG: anti-sigma factor [Acidobacteriales bacterium]|nr:anti-sigma factor [Terriglobales bacterium]
MTNEEHLALMDKLTLLALGELNVEEAAPVREHIETCEVCSREYQEVREGMAVLALSASGPAAPARARERLLRTAQVWDEPLGGVRDGARGTRSPGRSEADDMPRDVGASIPTYATMRRPWWSFVPAFAALVLAAFAILLWVRNTRLADQLQATQTSLSETQARLSQAMLVAETVTSPATQKVTLVWASDKPQPEITAMYLQRRRVIVLMAHHLPQVPEGKAYELWLLPANGAPPMAAGTFRPTANGSAVMTHSEMAATPEAKGFAVTIEAMSGSDKPTSPVIFSGL